MLKLLYALTFVALATGVVAIVPEAAFAQTALPWETPLETLTNSIKGPVAYFISLLGIVVAGAMLIFGGEINEFVRRLIMLVLVISLIIFSSNVLATLFSSAAGGGTYGI
jgi:type IV secretion system protein VirB2